MFKKKPQRGMSKKKLAQQRQDQYQQDIMRVRMPRGREVFGILEQRLGSSRSRVRCLDGKTRNCRIPGRLKRRLWVREGDVILVEPWEYSANDKGDIIFKYKPTQIGFLKRKGLLKGLEEAEEF